MGCSASHLHQHNTNEEDQPYSSSSSSSSFNNSTTTNSSSPKLPKPLSIIHHPPSKKGDTHHLVSLTSTTYGSLLLHKNPSKPDDHKLSSLFKNDPPHSVINTCELMDGLDDDDDHDFDLEISPKSISFHYVGDDLKFKSKPLWKYLSEESFLSKLDDNVVSSYRRALSSRQLGSSNNRVSSSDNYRIVVYFTSLRGIRKTYEDCCEVRIIFRGFRVKVDDKDISMDYKYRNELQSLLGVKAIRLPQVFIKGKHIGGLEEVKKLDECGELAKLLEGVPVRDPGIVCAHCGEARFVLCSKCSGSTKVFDEGKGRLRRCFDCNENGLRRCPGCC